MTAGRGQHMRLRKLLMLGVRERRYAVDHCRVSRQGFIQPFVCQSEGHRPNRCLGAAEVLLNRVDVGQRISRVHTKADVDGKFRTRERMGGCAHAAENQQQGLMFSSHWFPLLAA